MILIEQMFLLAYRFILAPTIIILLGILALFGNKKIRAGFKMRSPKGANHPWFDLPRNTHPLWFHCSSGEFEYAKPIIKLIKQKYPQQKILVTYFTPTYKGNIESFPQVDMSCPLPWDLPGPMSSFIRHHKPKALLIARTDLWPEMLYQAHNKRIPTLLFAATKGQVKTKDHWLLPFRKWIFNKLNVIYCVSQEDRINLLDSGATLVQTKGDTRYDQAFERLAHPKELNQILLHNSQDEPCLILGSSWLEDEKITLNACQKFIERKKLRLIIAPHEPTKNHIDHLQNLIKQNNLKSILYSESGDWPQNSVLIIDCVGILAELYTYTNFALIGGSFKSSVHSVMEALAAGNLCFVGPYHKNNREALEFSKLSIKGNFDQQLSYVNPVQNENQLHDLLTELLADKHDLTSLRADVISATQQKCGASLAVLEWVESVNSWKN